MLLEDYRNERLRKLQEIRERGIDPYPSVSRRTTKISEALEDFDKNMIYNHDDKQIQNY